MTNKRSPGGGRKPLSERGKTKGVEISLRPDEIEWLTTEAARRGLASRSRLVSDWISRSRARRQGW